MLKDKWTTVLRGSEPLRFSKRERNTLNSTAFSVASSQMTWKIISLRDAKNLWALFTTYTTLPILFRKHYLFLAVKS